MKFLRYLLGVIAPVFFLTGGTTDALPRFAYPQGYFDWPIKHPVRVSGTFMELRPNHFHAGIDLKSSRGRVGDPLYAPADGHVSRIKVDASGYGNALYIDHPNGYTTVYAHLEEYAPEIATYVRKQQYAAESFEIDVYPPADLLTVKKGDFIATMGNTGGSMGPHLHFEIRDTKTEEPINPLLFGLKIEDTRRPRMHRLKVYEMEGIGVEGSKTRSQSLVFRSGRYELEAGTLEVATPFVAFGVKVFDHHDGVTNWNGVFGMSMEVDGELRYQFEMERFAFEDTRYLNAHLDYQECVTRRSYYHRCFSLPGNKLNIYQQKKEQGIITLEPGKVHEVKVRAWDVDGNDVELHFQIKGKAESDPVESDRHNYYLYFDQENLIRTQDAELYFPLNCLYEDLPMEYKSTYDGSDEYYAKVLHVHDYQTPVHTYYDLSIQPNRAMSKLDSSKAFIAYCQPSGQVINCGGVWDDGMLKAQVRDMGDFSIMLDEVGPEIAPVYFRYDMRGRSRMTFRLKDNFKTARNIADVDYRAKVDGQWVLMTYDAKNKVLRYKLDDFLKPGEHQLRIEAWDAVGNVSIWERPFRL
jgi:hypothetical protein